MNSKKTIGTITFHGSHNYGSMLQAYALQEFIKDLTNKKVDYKIINFIPPAQKIVYKNMYDKTNRLKKKFQGLALYKYRQDIINQSQKFEDFKNTYMQLTELYSNREELCKANLNFDYYIAGSDQIWNFYGYMRDFDWAFFLDFTNSPHKISYAPSMGAIDRDIQDDRLCKLINELKKFSYISVRDVHSQKVVKDSINTKPQLMPDPTLLLSKSQWKEKLSIPTQNELGEYIFLYHFNNKDAAKLANKIRKYTKLPIVICQAPHTIEYFSNFTMKLDTGPLEFLTLLINSKFVLTKSHHACIFSTIFNKNFYAINSENDCRINDFLIRHKLGDHNITIDNYKTVLRQVDGINSEAHTIINNEKAKAENFFKDLLEL